MTTKRARTKAARRKQHNATAKERDRQWKADCLSRREQYLADAQRRELEGVNVKAAPPRPKDTLEQILDGAISGSSTTFDLTRTLGVTLPLLWGAGGLDLFELAKRRVPLFDTEGEALTCLNEPGMFVKPKDFKIADPNAPHTEQCKANHQQLVNEAFDAEQRLIAMGEEALAVYLYPTVRMCTCENETKGTSDNDPS